MATDYYTILANTSTKDLVASTYVETGPGTGVANTAISDMTNIVEIFIDASHSLKAAIDAAWTGEGGDLNSSFKLTAGNNDIESR